MADTVQDAITANRVDLIGLESARPANGSVGLVSGMTWYSTDTKTTYRYDGSVWNVEYRPLGPYATTVVGLPGTGTVVTTSKYRQLGKEVYGEITVDRTGAGLPNTTVSFTLPVTVANTSMVKHLGIGLFVIGGGGVQYDVRARYSGGNTVVVNFPGTSGTAIASGSNLNNTYPTGSNHPAGTTLYLQFSYEAA